MRPLALVLTLVIALAGCASQSTSPLPVAPAQDASVIHGAAGTVTIERGADSATLLLNGQRVTTMYFNADGSVTYNHPAPPRIQPMRVLSPLPAQDCATLFAQLSSAKWGFVSASALLLSAVGATLFAEVATLGIGSVLLVLGDTAAATNYVAAWKALDAANAAIRNSGCGV